MPRGPFDTTCDLVYGANGINPGVRYASGVCRFVPDEIEVPTLFPLSDRVAYVTMDFAIPNSPVSVGTSGIVTTNYDYADFIAIPHGSNDYFQVLFVETVAYRRGGPYIRAHVRPAPGGGPRTPASLVQNFRGGGGVLSLATVSWNASLVPTSLGNLLLVAFQLLGTAPLMVNTPPGWTLINARSSATGINNLALFVRRNAPATTSVTFNFSGSPVNSEWFTSEWLPGSVVGVVDQFVSNDGNSFVIDTGATQPTSLQNELAIAVFGGATTGAGPTGGFTQFPGGSNPEAGWAYKLVGATGPQQSSVLGSISAEWAALLSVLR